MEALELEQVVKKQTARLGSDEQYEALSKAIAAERFTGQPKRAERYRL
ncbi:hypothetical protein [Bradyrhizobium neotropicale]|nr:hypothetical protein [Bradyrhizobium neotropicale]MBO4220906.1 hypothetical protein [Bradyrhizobium neotropicale]